MFAPLRLCVKSPAYSGGLMEFPVRPDGSLELNNPPQLPEILDLLIVGGGPAGTAAALRARELGLRALVIDRDDLMSRIRDYSKDKLIYPHYGGGDRMRFPKAGELVAQIPFAPIDKDDLCRRWKSLYYQHGLGAQTGVELLGLQGQDGSWKAQAFNHNQKSELAFQARHVAIAVGRGVPRTLDIPGNALGVNYRLSDPGLFVQGPVCVIGGGTSAAEAVIALSRAKVRAADPSSVYWSYRGEKMPRVSKALHEEFFEAFVVNGNIRYCPRSEPAGIVMAEDHQEYFSLRTDRRRLEGRPCETSHLEFPKEQVIACIGQDLPERFLNSMGIFMGEEGKRKHMLVRPVLETQQPNVYLIGDVLSQYYFETEDFQADPAAFQRIRHPGNIKSAVRDGVYIADVVADRLKGGNGFSVVIADLEEEAAESGTEALEQTIAPRPADEISRIIQLEEEAPAMLLRVLPGGIEDSEHPVPSDGALTIGRSGCDLSFADDDLLSERHASISRGAKGFLLRDDGSRNGVFFQLVPGKARVVVPGDLISLGRQFLLVGENDQGAFFSHYDQSGKSIGRHPLSEEPLILGRQSPDVTLDRSDKTLSRRHLTLAMKEQGILATDLNSSNGTYLKIRDALLLEHDDRFRAGQQQFLFQLRDEGPRQRRYAQPVTEKESAAQATPSPTPTEDDRGSVTFEGLGKTCPLAGRTISRAAEEHGIEIDVECEMGLCGLDPVRIVSGQEHLNPCGEQESEALRKKGLEPGQYRFACVARASGPVVVELLEQ